VVKASFFLGGYTFVIAVFVFIIGFYGTILWCILLISFSWLFYITSALLLNYFGLIPEIC